MIEHGAVVVRAEPTAAAAVCPRCQVCSGRVHSRYKRCLVDAAIGGQLVQVRLRVRRFFCDNTCCESRTFAEQVDGLTAPHARRTPLAQRMLTDIALALAGRAGARLARAVGVRTSRDTMLRLVRRVPEPAIGPVAVLGVDDFAFRRGHRYGTIILDVQRNRPIDVINGRDGAALAAWLRDHPGVSTICRDRAGGYSDGARHGAPEAMQVADRFHVWQNLGEAVEKTVNAHREDIPEPRPDSETVTESATPQRIAAQPPEKKVVTRMRRQRVAVKHLRAQGMSKAAIGRQLGLHPATVRKLDHARTVEDLIAKTEQRTHLVDDYTDHLHHRWNAGERNATQLFREIVELGYPGGELAVQRYLRQFRHGRGFRARTGPKPPSVREVTSWILTHPDTLPEGPALTLKAILARSQPLKRLATHVRAFADMMTGLHGHRLPSWITSVERSNLTPLAGFARNLNRDYEAIHNGLTQPYSSGPVEGTINRVKTLKRQMYGRANLDLLPID